MFEWVNHESDYVRVYRVEHVSDYYGPYRRVNRAMENMVKEMLYTHRNHETHPTAWMCDANDDTDIVVSKDRKNVRCGFSSINCLKSWFDGYLDKLDKLGFVVKVYRVKRCNVAHCSSYKQLVFIRNNPVKILRMYEIGY